MSQWRSCFGCLCSFKGGPNTLNIEVAYPNGWHTPRARVSFCDECTARIDRALDEQDDAIKHRTPMYHPAPGIRFR